MKSFIWTWWRACMVVAASTTYWIALLSTCLLLLPLAVVYVRSPMLANFCERVLIRLRSIQERLADQS